MLRQAVKDEAGWRLFLKAVDGTVLSVRAGAGWRGLSFACSPCRLLDSFEAYTDYEVSLVQGQPPVRAVEGLSKGTLHALLAVWDEANTQPLLRLARELDVLQP